MPEFPNTSFASLIFFHHIRAVFTITDTIPAPCENRSQIVSAEPVPASRGDQVFPRLPVKRSLPFWIHPKGLDKRIATKRASDTKKQVENP
jgi:hypothetical protein